MALAASVLGMGENHEVAVEMGGGESQAPETDYSDAEDISVAVSADGEERGRRPVKRMTYQERLSSVPPKVPVRPPRKRRVKAETDVREEMARRQRAEAIDALLTRKRQQYHEERRIQVLEHAAKARARMERLLEKARKRAEEQAEQKAREHPHLAPTFPTTYRNTIPSSWKTPSWYNEVAEQLRVLRHRRRGRVNPDNTNVVGSRDVVFGRLLTPGVDAFRDPPEDLAARSTPQPRRTPPTFTRKSSLKRKSRTKRYTRPQATRAQQHVAMVRTLPPMVSLDRSIGISDGAAELWSEGVGGVRSEGNPARQHRHYKFTRMADTAIRNKDASLRLLSEKQILADDLFLPITPEDTWWEGDGEDFETEGTDDETGSMEIEEGSSLRQEGESMFGEDVGYVIHLHRRGKDKEDDRKVINDKGKEEARGLGETVSLMFRDEDAPPPPPTSAEMWRAIVATSRRASLASTPTRLGSARGVGSESIGSGPQVSRMSSAKVRSPTRSRPRTPRTASQSAYGPRKIEGAADANLANTAGSGEDRHTAKKRDVLGWTADAAPSTDLSTTTNLEEGRQRGSDAPPSPTTVRRPLIPLTLHDAINAEKLRIAAPIKTIRTIWKVV
ncbi:hypothetical protein HK104_009480 [Borealophlyctis nickersoniae]|nr:hypothetical protein HK104_009480 [Borealophlyctis nickersoniae]